MEKKELEKFSSLSWGQMGILSSMAQEAAAERKVAMTVKEKTVDFCPQASGWWMGLWGMISLAAGLKL